MRQEPLNVMVTGGTGFVGFHTVRALVSAGHSVRLLVRNPGKMRRVFAPFGLENLPWIEGDITDEASVNRALSGCNAVVHAAALVSVHASDSEKVLENNLLGTRLVLGGAWQRGIRRMIQVSSTTALFRRGAAGVDEHSPLGTALSGYGRSKIECEKFVRELQGKGAPIYTTYPGSIMGPNDPGLSEAMIGLRTFINTRLLLDTTSGIQIIDVRDLAKAHLALLERGGPPARYLIGGNYYSWEAYAGLMKELTGGRLHRLRVQPRLLKAAGAIADALSPVFKIDLPLSRESVTYATEWAIADDSLIKKTLDFDYVPTKKTLRDSIEWLHSAGHLRGKHII
ncbi:MAG: NAD-dependent epimerase/dehydratase family protein [Halieaceae bacterium]|nr:NAD-dependent epimerase/dehydratase family protein [Halieaceae bacterium]